MIKFTFFMLALLLPTLSIGADVNPESACTGVKETPIPVADQPQKIELVKLKGCDSASSYYGIGVPIDYAKARACAYAEREAVDDLVFGGSSILMMLYANGFGAKKNVALAKHFACKIGGAPAEVASRLEHLEELKNGAANEKPFDLCDDITSGYMGGHCSGLRERIAAVSRSSTLAKVLTGWTDAEKAAFKKLQDASKKFTEERSRNEVDLSGTARSTFIVEEESIQERDFLESLQKLEAKRAPKYTVAQAKKEDQKLNALYEKIQKSEGSQELWGTVTKNGIKTAQKAWLGYRDAWVEFAKLKYSSYSPESIAAWFTKKRNHMLSSFAR